MAKDKQRRIQENIERRKNGGYLSGEDEEIFRKAQKGSGGGQRYKRSTLRRIAEEIEKKYSDIGLKLLRLLPKEVIQSVTKDGQII
ncbi:MULTISPECIES: hypothetical protein [unclassified Chryseobacterium]|uniref:hypothetical protein n=1 Tax=unclassified Chryseobacterium TaxID=2593645 RepID=UPI001AE7FB7F|nr:MULTISPECIES: hypothetical protein [unclassified Chryseobacterium]MBP1166433.1 hypothetical protein [Chryseobacterium sp. PvR013]MDR4891624.1 hypothetical protein [Chryseobacterium sp. CFS7]